MSDNETALWKLLDEDPDHDWHDEETTVTVVQHYLDPAAFREDGSVSEAAVRLAAQKAVDNHPSLIREPDELDDPPPSVHRGPSGSPIGSGPNRYTGNRLDHNTLRSKYPALNT